MLTRVQSLWERSRTSPIGRRLARGTIWSLGGAVTGRVLTLASTIVLARMLGKEGFGELGIIQSTLTMFGAFAGFGLGITSTRYVATHYKTNPQLAGEVMSLTTLVSAASGAVIAMVFLIAADWLAAHALAAPQLADVLRISSIAVFFASLNGAQGGAMSGFEAFGRLTILSTVTAILAIPLTVIGAYWYGLRGCVWGLVIGQALTWVVFHIALRQLARERQVPLRFKGSLKHWRLLHQFSLPAFICSLLIVPTTWICNAILVNGTGGYAAMGAFNMALQWRAAIMFLPSAIGTALMPVLSSVHGENRRQTYRKVVLLNLLMAGSVTLLGGGIVAACAPLIVRAYGEEFIGHEWLIVVMVGSGVLIALNNVVAADLTGRGRMWLGTVFCVGVSTTIVLLAWWLAGPYGAMGLAVATLLAYVLHTLWQGVYLWLALQNDRRTE